MPAQIVMADTASDRDGLLASFAARNAQAVIPSNPSHARKHSLDRHLSAQRRLVECCFSTLKQLRRVATRFKKTARNDLAIVTIAAIVLRIR